MAGLSERHRGILEARGLDAETLARHGVSSSSKLGGDCVVIPFTEAGKVVNHKYRTIAGDKRFCQDKDARKTFWNVDVIADPTLANHPLVITEGEFDAMIAIQCGFPRTVSVPDGAPAEAIGEGETTKYTFLDNAPQALKDVREIILATDGDGPGVNLMNDLALRLGKARCKWIQYPRKDRDSAERWKDLNEVFLAYGASGVTRTLQAARWIVVDGVYRMSELPPLPPSVSFSTGMILMDDHYRLRLGDLTVVTGIPSHGKTTFVNEVCGRMAQKHGWTTAFASFEQEPQTDHRRNLRTFFSGKRVIDQSVDEVDAADRWIDQFFSFIVPSEDDDVTLSWCLERCAAAVIRHEAKIIVIDPWNEMDHIRPPDMTLTEYTGFAIKQFRKFAKKYRVHMVIVAHPTKLKKNDNGSYPIPTLYDISDSAHWYNKCEVGIVVHRVDKVRTLIRIAKTKYKDQIGEPGDVYGALNMETCRYTIEEPTEGSVAA